MKLTKDEVLHTLWCLATGDDEETRIVDLNDKLSYAAQILIANGDYTEACKVAIRQSMVHADLDDCIAWAIMNDFEDPNSLGDDMMGAQHEVWLPTVSLGHSTVDGIEYVMVCDEGMAPGWLEQIQQAWPDRYGPYFIYKTTDPVCTIVSCAPLDNEQLTAAMYPEDGKL